MGLKLDGELGRMSVTDEWMNISTCNIKCLYYLLLLHPWAPATRPFTFHLIKLRKRPDVGKGVIGRQTTEKVEVNERQKHPGVCLNYCILASTTASHHHFPFFIFTRFLFPWEWSREQLAFISHLILRLVWGKCSNLIFRLLCLHITRVPIRGGLDDDSDN